MAQRVFRYVAALCLLAASFPAAAAEVEGQPLVSQVRRLIQALELLGSPLSTARRAELEAAFAGDESKIAPRVRAVLDPLCLATITINSSSDLRAEAGRTTPVLVQQGWRTFIIKVANYAGVRAPLRATSPNAAPLVVRSANVPDPTPALRPEAVSQRWLDVKTFDKQPLTSELSGLALEYRIVELYSRDVGRRDAELVFDIGAGSPAASLNFSFRCEPAVEVVLDVLDDDGSPTTAEFVFEDAHHRIYPAPSRRLAPDFFFQNQIYRHSGESVMLAAGKYTVRYGRGPEYLRSERTIEVPRAVSHREQFRLKRWINLADLGWYSGDHHIHAAGCAHYDAPSEGVQPSDMLRHILGEDLNVGCVLSWGPCWYYQKQYFEGTVHKLSRSRNLMRYDVEVSGFPSSPCGHLCLLRLSEDDYPGTKKVDDWPSWDLPILKWAKQQGAVVGFAHSGWGLQVKSQTLPTLEMPAFDGIGANEYIVDVAHDACDFISTVDTPPIWELNIWYHTLNCGFQTRISGETDFPCIYGERVGLGRAYVKCPKSSDLNYDNWADGIRDGRSYCTDGLSHLVDFTVNGLDVGEKSAGERASVLNAASDKPLAIRLRAAALLEDKPRDDIRRKRLDERPYWHIERARVGDSGEVPVELIVNGRSVETKRIKADGKLREVSFSFTPPQSSWVAVRIFPSSHTNPVFVLLDDKPIRASRRSAQWCLDAVDVCLKEKLKTIRPAEHEAAKAAYEVARERYRKIIRECAAEPGS